MNLLAVAFGPRQLGTAEFVEGSQIMLSTFTLPPDHKKSLRTVESVIDDLVRHLQPSALAILAPSMSNHKSTLIIEQRLSGVVLATFYAHYPDGMVHEVTAKAARTHVTGNDRALSHDLLQALKEIVANTGVAYGANIDEANALAYAVGVVALQQSLAEVS